MQLYHIPKLVSSSFSPYTTTVNEEEKKERTPFAEHVVDIKDLFEDEEGEEKAPRTPEATPLPSEALQGDTEEKEERLYNRALDIYETALSSGSEKTRFTAARHMVEMRLKKRAAEEKLAAGRATNNFLITGEGMANIFARLSHGAQGGALIATQGEGDERRIEGEARIIYDENRLPIAVEREAEEG